MRLRMRMRLRAGRHGDRRLEREGKVRIRAAGNEAL